MDQGNGCPTPQTVPGRQICELGLSRIRFQVIDNKSMCVGSDFIFAMKCVTWLLCFANTVLVCGRWAKKERGVVRNNISNVFLAS